MKLVIILFLMLYKFSKTLGVNTKIQMPERWQKISSLLRPANIRRHRKKRFVYPFGWKFLSLDGRVARKAHNALWNLWVPSQYLLKDREETKRALIDSAGRRNFLPDV